MFNDDKEDFFFDSEYNDRNKLNNNREGNMNNDQHKFNRPTRYPLIFGIIISGFIFLFIILYVFNTSSNSTTQKIETSKAKQNIVEPEVKPFDDKLMVSGPVDTYETISDVEDLLKVKLVEIKVENLEYFAQGRGLVIYRDTDSTLYYIKVNYLVDSNNEVKDFKECLIDNKAIVNSCFASETYIISEDQQALIEKDVFYKNYYRK